jgi:hypothetical protein
VLNHVRAKDAGAGFTESLEGSTPCHTSSSGGKTGYSAGDEVVSMDLNCIARPLGGKANFEGYVGFTLKNGWRVKSHEVVRGSGNFAEGAGKGWSWVTGPPSGANPYFKLHFWADADRALDIGIKITIEGAEGTSPY